MAKQIKETLFIILEIFGLSLALFFVVAMGIPSRELSNIKEDGNVIQETLRDYREIYLYDDRYVSGDDVISLMQTKKGLLAYYIDIDPSPNIVFRQVSADFIDYFDDFVNTAGVKMTAWDMEIMSNELFLDTKPEWSSTDVGSATVLSMSKSANVYYATLCRLSESDLINKYGLIKKSDFRYTTTSNTYGLITKIDDFGSTDTDKFWNDQAQNTTYDVQAVFFLRDDNAYRTEDILKTIKK